MRDLIIKYLKEYVEKTENKHPDSLEEVKKFQKPRKWSESYCKKTSCKSMGFSQKASCRPYKDCY